MTVVAFRLPVSGLLLPKYLLDSLEKTFHTLVGFLFSCIS